MGEVVGFGGVTKLPVPVDKVLNAAIKEHEERPFARVIVIAVYEDGVEEFFATSESDGGTHLWDMERFRHRLMREADIEMETPHV